MKTVPRAGIQAAAENAAERVRAMAEAYPARRAASEEEKAAAEELRSVLEGVADEVTETELPVAPAAHYGWVFFSVVCLLLAYVTYFFVSFLSMVFILLAVIPAVVQGLLRLTAFDKAYVSRTTECVRAVRKCTGEKRRRIVVAAHLDAPPVMPLKAALGGKAVALITALSVLGGLYLTAAVIARWAYLGSMGSALAAGDWLAVGLAGIVFVPLWISLMFTASGSKTAAGAADGLAGCAVAVSLLELLAKEDIASENTELEVLLVGASECGQRGAAEYCKTLAAEDKDAEIIVLGALREREAFCTVKSELMGTARASARIAEGLRVAAEKAGIDLAERAWRAGASDASALARAGLDAVCLTASSPLPEYTSTPADGADKISADVLADCISLLLGYVGAAETGADEKDAE